MKLYTFEIVVIRARGDTYTRSEQVTPDVCVATFHCVHRKQQKEIRLKHCHKSARCLIWSWE